MRNVGELGKVWYGYGTIIRAVFEQYGTRNFRLITVLPRKAAPKSARY